MRTIAIANQKGGTAKTTTAHSLAAAWGRAGQKTLLVDLDGQHALSKWCGRRGAVGWYEALAGGADPRSAIERAVMPRVDLLPACEAMGRIPLRPTQRTAVQQALAHVSGYRWALLDCPPAINVLAENAILAADVVLVPVECSYLALDGVEEMLRILGDLDRQGEKRPTFFVVCRADLRLRVAKAVLAELRDGLGEQVLETVVRATCRMQEAPDKGVSIFDHAPESTAAADYAALADELGRKIK